MTNTLGCAIVHGETAYFSNKFDVCSYRVTDNKWTKLQPSKCKYFSMAVINNQVTTIGGWDIEGWEGKPTNSLLCLQGNGWKEVLPPMPTSRMSVTAATTPTHLVVAGGENKFFLGQSTVEVLNTETLQWSTASSLPQVRRLELVAYP